MICTRTAAETLPVGTEAPNTGLFGCGVFLAVLFLLIDLWCSLPPAYNPNFYGNRHQQESFSFELETFDLSYLVQLFTPFDVICFERYSFGVRRLHELGCGSLPKDVIEQSCYWLSTPLTPCVKSPAQDSPLQQLEGVELRSAILRKRVCFTRAFTAEI